MTCSDVQRILPECLDAAPEGAFQTAFETHLKSCPACANLVSDLKSITSAARELAASEEPSPQVWLRIAAQLRVEGIIHEPEPETSRRPILVPLSPVRRRWSAWWFAPVAASLLVAGSYVINHRPAPKMAQQVTAPPVSPTTTTPTAAIPATPVASAPTPAAEQMAKSSTKPIVIAKPAAKPADQPMLEPEPSAEDQQFLTVVSTQAPAMRAAYESQLQAVNTDIREVQNYLHHNPGDMDARQHLMDAYQQKALLYQLALDRIQ
jgi:hypothetical protein